MFTKHLFQTNVRPLSNDMGRAPWGENISSKGKYRLEWEKMVHAKDKRRILKTNLTSFILVNCENISSEGKYCMEWKKAGLCKGYKTDITSMCPRTCYCK